MTFTRGQTCMTTPLTFGSLFAGIGGFDLGFERAGMVCKWQVEIDEYATRVLEKHWPDVRRWDDVRTFPPEGDDWRVDVIAGGFPCQDISNAGQRAGIDGERSGLWGEFDRIIGVLRPRIVVVENVAALLVRGMGRVIGDLAACGYDAEWRIVPAGGPGGVGAPHRRERVFIVAHARGARNQWRSGECVGPNGTGTRGESVGSSQHARNLADAAGVGMEGDGAIRVEVAQTQTRPRIFGRDCTGTGEGHWATEPDVGRVANGVPSRVDRLRGLGNAIVPQVAEWIGRRIVEAL